MEDDQSVKPPLFLFQKGEVEGPYEFKDIKELLLRQEIPPSALAGHSAEGNWTPVSLLVNPRSGPITSEQFSSPKRFHKTKIIGSICTIIIVAVTCKLILQSQHAVTRKDGESVVQKVAMQQNSQLEAKNKEIKTLSEKLLKEAALKMEGDERIQRLQADLKLAAEDMTRERGKSAILEDLSKALASDQLQLKESLLPAIGIPLDLFLNVQIGPGLLKVDELAVKKSISGPLTTAGFNVVFKAPTDRQYLLVNYGFTQASDSKGRFAAYNATIRCVGLAWQSGSVRPTILFSNYSGGYAGSASGYTKSILADAEMFGEMIADSLGKIDRDALVVDYDILDPDAELTEAAEKLRNLTPSDVKPVAATGTGFIVSSKGLIITNHHVIEGHDEVEIWLPTTGKNLTARVIASDSSNDLAFLRVEKETEVPANLTFPVIAKLPPEVGQMVFTVGFPVPEIMGREPKYSQGVLNAQSGGRDDTRLLQHSIPIQPGNSGGFLISEAGQVCGIVQSTLNAAFLLGESGSLPQNVNYAIKSECIWTFATAQGLAAEVGEGERKPIKAKDALRLSVLITTREK